MDGFLPPSTDMLIGDLVVIDMDIDMDIDMATTGAIIMDTKQAMPVANTSHAMFTKNTAVACPQQIEGEIPQLCLPIVFLPGHQQNPIMFIPTGMGIFTNVIIRETGASKIKDRLQVLTIPQHVQLNLHKNRVRVSLQQGLHNRAADRLSLLLSRAPIKVIS